MDSKIDKMLNSPKRQIISKSKYKYGRRRSRSLGSVISADLANIIDKTLTPQERLKLLIEYSLQNAFHIAEREVSSNIDSNKLADCTTDCIMNIDKSLEKQDLYTLAIDGDQSFTAQKSFAKCFEEFSKESDKLSEEIKVWDELVKESEILEIEKKDTPNMSLENIPDCDELRSFNYSNVTEKFTEAAESYSFQVKNLKKVSDKLKRFADMTKKYNEYVNEKVSCDFSKTIPESPRTLIKKFCQKT